MVPTEAAWCISCQPGATRQQDNTMTLTYPKAITASSHHHDPDRRKRATARKTMNTVAKNRKMGIRTRNGRRLSRGGIWQMSLKILRVAGCVLGKHDARVGIWKTGRDWQASYPPSCCSTEQGSAIEPIHLCSTSKRQVQEAVWTWHGSEARSEADVLRCSSEPGESLGTGDADNTRRTTHSGSLSSSCGEA